MATPYITVIIPTHSRPSLLRRSLTSVLQSSFRELEVLVISDSRCSQTYEVVHSLMDKRLGFHMNTSFLGPADSRNCGIELARGKYTYFIDDDDSVEYDYLERLANASRLSAGDIIYSDATVVEEDRLQKGQISRYFFSVEDLPLESLWVKNFIHINTLLYPTSLIKRLSFDNQLRSLEDWDFLLNSLQLGANFKYLKNTNGAIIYKDYINNNRRGNSQDATNIKVIRDYFRIYSKFPAPTDDLKNKRKALFKDLALQPGFSAIDFIV